MTIKFLKAMKSMGILSLLFLLITSCSNDDLNSIDAGFIDNLNFVTKELISEVEFSNEDIDSVVSDANGQFLLGVFDESGVGKIRGSFVSQLALPSNIYTTDTVRQIDILTTSKIDDVVLYLPYHSTLKSIAPNVYELDSVFGIQEIDGSYRNFTFEVHELATFLNPLDPTDPSSGNVYYSSKDYASEKLLGTLDYSPIATDTVTYIDRLVYGVSYKDTIKLANNAPRIAIHLDANYFQTKILDFLPKRADNIPSEFQSQESFIRYFKGLYVKVTSTDGASIVTLPLANSHLEMYYTNIETSMSTGYKDTIAKTMRFNFGGVKAVKYESIERSSEIPGKLYIQGTSGSQANIQILQAKNLDENGLKSDLEVLRENSNNDAGNPIWLINEANLLFYVDGTVKPNVDKLFLYKKVPEINSALPYNSQLLDYLTTRNIEGYINEGDLSQDENDAYYYKFRITDYITKLLEGTNTKNADNLGLKIYNPGDYPTTDTLIRTSNWNPRGVVLYGGAQLDTDGKRLKLQINYSYQNR
jgi:hypothetical protein